MAHVLSAVPFVGTLLDKRTSLEAFIILLVFGLAFGLLTMTRGAVGQIAGICVFVVLRPLMYTAVSDFCAKVFGCALSFLSLLTLTLGQSSPSAERTAWSTRSAGYSASCSTRWTCSQSTHSRATQHRSTLASCS
jgi:hypothetical protein